MTAPQFTRGRLNVYSGPSDVTRVARALHGVGRKIALIPTMGALHEGHLELIRRARRIPNTVLAVSIFVNPLQFGPNEDFERYPRALEGDLRACEAEGVEVVFNPSVPDVYPPGSAVTVHPGPLGDELEGAIRPGHFAGVLTVVAKLLNIVDPDYALFGEKDYQQLVLIKRMVADLNLAANIVGVPTVRESDGLALSSRNVYLSEEDRKRAVVLSAALTAGVHAGRFGADAVLEAVRNSVAAVPEFHVDYLELRAGDLSPAPDEGPARLLIAGRLGAVRLIDNAAVQLGGEATAEQAEAGE
ncbi:MAG: pantoate--beta-alanine ligase [Pseudonocardiaceae bacterium]|nr:pantoate--beta-alanine ligase [Pseudonocardiaceae bacterium]